MNLLGASSSSAARSGNAGSASSSSNAPLGVAPHSALAIAANEALRIAKRVIREDQGKSQSFSKPSFILWELVNGSMKWRLRWDQQRSDEDKQALVRAGGSRFCAGTHFGEVAEQDRERPLGYGGPNQFVNAQAEKLAERDHDGNYTTECIKIKKIFVVAVMVDMIEDWFPESVQSLAHINDFKKRSSYEGDFMKAWYEALDDVLAEQAITLEDLVSAEMARERLKSDKLAKWAEILRKPEESITADELGFMKQSIAERQSNLQTGGSSSGTKPARGSQVGNDGAVDKKSLKASEGVPSGRPPMPRRPTPPIDNSDPPEKRRKGDPKGAADRAPSGSKGAQKGAANRAASAHSSGKGKGKWKGDEKGKHKGEILRTPSARPNERTQPVRDHLDYLPRPPVALVARNDNLVEREDGVAIRRNPNTDFRIAERQRRENAVPLRRDAPRDDPHDAQYREWMNDAWVGHHPDPPAENRHRGENDGAWQDWRPRENARGRDEAWHPSLQPNRGRGGTWHPPPPPSNLQPRLRSRTPYGKGKGKGDDLENRVYVHDGRGQRWEVVDHEDDEYWDRQNELSQFRRNMEFRRAN